MTRIREVWCVARRVFRVGIGAALVVPLAPACSLIPHVTVPGTCPDTSKVEAIDQFDFVASFGLPRDAATKVKSGLSAAAAVKSLATTIDARLLDACGAIDRDLGDAAAYPDGPAACAGAITAIGAAKAKLGPAVAIAVDAAPPECSATADAYGACAGTCDPANAGKPEQASASCKARCEAQIDARATCTPPHVAVRITGASDDASAAAFEGTLERNLPRLLAVGQGMAKGAVQLTQEVPAIAESGQAVVKLAMGDKIRGAALAACVASPFGQVAGAAQSIGASVRVTADVQASVSTSASTASQ